VRPFADPLQSATAAAAPGFPLRGRRWPAVLVVSLLLGSVAIVGVRSSANEGRDPGLLAQSELVEKAGVRVVRVAVTGAGGLVDLRFQVVDPDKATVVHDRKKPPSLILQSGQVLRRPLMGHMPHSTPKAGRIYYVIFDNTRYALAPGRTVTVELGGIRLDDVAVS
jgi:hypothetical protein